MKKRLDEDKDARSIGWGFLSFGGTGWRLFQSRLDSDRTHLLFFASSGQELADCRGNELCSNAQPTVELPGRNLANHHFASLCSRCRAQAARMR